jgi:hypothetical protein
MCDGFKWVQDFLSKRTQKVVLDGVTSSCADVISGVPQGTVMDLLLCLTFINDLPEHITSDVRLFADDCLLYRHIQNYEDAAAWHPRRFLCKKPKVLLALPLMLVICWVQFSLLLIVALRYLLFSITSSM